MSPAHRNFRRWLVAITLLGLAVRLVYILVERAGPDFHAAPGVVGGDAFFYHKGAQLFREHGFISPHAFHFENRIEPAADHPPLYLIWLAIPSFFDILSPLSHMVWSALLGTVTIVLVGLLGRIVAGDRVGLVAAFLAAIYPNIWSHDGFLVSETMAIAMVTLTLLLAYRYAAEPTTGRAFVMGLAGALAALSRAELALLFPLALIPLIVRVREQTGRERFRRLVAAGMAALIPIAPWVGFNLVRFERPVLLSSGFEVTLRSATCDETYYGEFTGYWSARCAEELRGTVITPEMDQSEEAVEFRRAAFEYLGDNLDRLPVVILARWGRITGLWKPSQQVSLEQFPEGRERWVAWTALSMWYPLGLLAIAGAVVLRRRRALLFPLLAMPIAVWFTITVMFATTRYRATAETTIVVLAAVAIDAFLRRRKGDAGEGDGEGTIDVRAPGPTATPAETGARDS